MKNIRQQIENIKLNKKFTVTVVEPDGNVKSYSGLTLHNDVLNLSRKLSNAGLHEGDVIGFRSVNCYEWIVWDLATLMNRIVLHVFPEDNVEESAMELLVKYRFKLFVDFLHSNHAVRGVVGIDIHQKLSGLRKINESAKAEPGLLSMVYSSGTSGSLKGLKVTEQGAMSIVHKFIQSFHINEDDKALIFLPMSNFQQRLIIYASILSGFSVVISTFSQVFYAAKNLKPTFMIAPPLFYENMMRLYRGKADENNSLCSGFGGRVRFLITGMAPIKPEIIRHYNNSGLNMFEAYGVTEVGMISWNTPENNRLGSVGQLLNREKILFSDEGELLVHRKDSLSTGYFHNPGNVDEVFVGEYIHTGDIAYIADDGFLCLKGRKKDIILSKNGMKYHPEIIENGLYEEFSLTWCVMVQYDDSSVVIYVNWEEESMSISTEQLRIYCTDLLVKHMSGLRLKRVVVGKELPSIENSLLTRNMKVNRSKVRERILEFIKLDSVHTELEMTT